MGRKSQVVLEPARGLDCRNSALLARDRFHHEGRGDLCVLLSLRGCVTAQGGLCLCACMPTRFACLVCRYHIMRIYREREISLESQGRMTCLWMLAAVGLTAAAAPAVAILWDRQRGERGMLTWYLRSIPYAKSDGNISKIIVVQYLVQAVGSIVVPVL